MFYSSSRFRKQFKKSPKKIYLAAFDRLVVLEKSEFDVVLNSHKLSGKYAGYRSINITGDIRIVYKRVPNGFYLVAIGTHSELYKK
ncbi:MAG: type II toxin-antitoxin system mRNA interferase toxin, RelE/StbE family [Candidatus Pacebacteria bacterium]|nr:type II toxin-antitoxin system mRNA interferase toxin, RelE/StbE family [Candidatus Paceibacterota bacterium]